MVLSGGEDNIPEPGGDTSCGVRGAGRMWKERRRDQVKSVASLQLLRPSWEC